MQKKVRAIDGENAAIEPSERAELPTILNTTASTKRSALETALARDVAGDIMFDGFNRGRYATDASFYQMMPAGVVAPRSIDDALRALAIARDHGTTVTPRGGGTSQCGQTINRGLIVDFSKYCNRLISVDPEARTLRGRAGHRAGRPQPSAQAAWPVVPGRCLHRLARDHRRHGRQQ